MTTSFDWLQRTKEIQRLFLQDGLDYTVPRFQELVWEYYHEHERAFPWRETTNPYHILVSEVMLQQTQAPRVVIKYHQFLQQFPTLSVLESAPISHLLGAWQGLGYNRRALALQRAAKVLVSDFQGIFPQQQAELETLPGIGPYTSGAICVFAFNQPVVLIETNIRRLFIHTFFEEGRVVDDKEITPLIQATLEKDSARLWYYALMDFGHDLAKMVPNPNTRSKHYTKQSAFEGSHRQVRGRILKLLLLGSASVNKLATELDIQAADLEPTLQQLKNEGFISLDNGGISLLS